MAICEVLRIGAQVCAVRWIWLLASAG